MFTDYCPSCRLPGKRARLCPSCSRLALEERFDTFMTRCPVCFHPLVSDIYVCRECRMRIYSVYDYSASFVKRLVVRWKIEGERSLSPLVSNMFSDTLSELGLLPGTVSLAKVPSSGKGKLRRGWDQMADILSFLGHRRGYDTSDIIVRTRDSSVQQKNLDRSGRFEAALSAFTLRKNFTSPFLPVVILDDITTTGASLDACRMILESVGIEVWGAVTLLQQL